MPHEWDASGYDSLPLPHQRWGARTLARLPLAGHERVMDAGAGTGRDTAALAALLPEGRVVAVDASARMLERLRARLAGHLHRVAAVRADLARPLPLAGGLDAVMSVAAFHWIPDHAALFSNLAAVLRPGGRLVAECGGRGNIAAVESAVTAVLGEAALEDEAAGVWNFAGAGDTAFRLREAGFTDVDVSLVPDPARLATARQFRDYLAVVVLGGHLARLPGSRHEDFVSSVAARLTEPVVDYVRLTISAVRDG